METSDLLVENFHTIMPPPDTALDLTPVGTPSKEVVLPLRVQPTDDLVRLVGKQDANGEFHLGVRRAFSPPAALESFDPLAERLVGSIDRDFLPNHRARWADARQFIQ